MNVEVAVELGLRREVVEPPDIVLRQLTAEEVVGLHHLGPVDGRLAQPALAVAADPRRIRKLTEPGQRLGRPRARRAVVPPEEVAVGTEPVGVGEHGLERGQVAVDVVKKD